MKSHSIEVAGDRFETEVLESSKTVPVVVDFWAPWCAPCRALKPVLEKLAAEFGGRFLLAKVNTDENPQVASRYGVRGIPNVKGFRDGKVVAEFTGALPEQAVREFLSRLIPSAAEQLRLEARQAIGEGDFEAAENKLQLALNSDPADLKSRIDLAELLIARQAWSETDLVLQAIPADQDDERVRALRSRVTLWKRAQELPSAVELRGALERSPADVGLKLHLAERCLADGDPEAALETLLAIVRNERGDSRERARKAMLEAFMLAGDRDDLVTRYRKLLAGALY